ncbi:antitoxin [Pseudomonas sp. R16(2017)]|uniref:type II toxin-antitoxin system RelB family antitoxin n=1 Tax=Pseudomonas sp. R16(2017) TaxID=1981704 RepID=UPI000A1EA771|nr:antitoxin [Pseudomonas sp. R16(2017)]
MTDPTLIDPLCPVVPDLEPEEQAASYDRWFRAKVQASLDDPRPSIAHDQVMAEMQALMEAKRKTHDAD